RAEDVRERIELREPWQRSFDRLVRPEQLQRRVLSLGQFFERRPSGQFFFCEEAIFCLFERVQLIEQPSGLESERGAGFTRRPDVYEPMKRILLLLNPELIPRGAWGALTAPKATALIKD